MVEIDAYPKHRIEGFSVRRPVQIKVNCIINVVRFNLM